MFFKFINKCQTNILRCASPSSLVCNFLNVGWPFVIMPVIGICFLLKRFLMFWKSGKIFIIRIFFHLLKFKCKRCRAEINPRQTQFRSYDRWQQTWSSWIVLIFGWCNRLDMRIFCCHFSLCYRWSQVLVCTADKVRKLIYELKKVCGWIMYQLISGQ